MQEAAHGSAGLHELTRRPNVRLVAPGLRPDQAEIYIDGARVEGVRRVLINADAEADCVEVHMVLLPGYLEVLAAETHATVEEEPETEPLAERVIERLHDRFHAQVGTRCHAVEGGWCSAREAAKDALEIMAEEAGDEVAFCEKHKMCVLDMGHSGPCLEAVKQDGRVAVGYFRVIED